MKRIDWNAEKSQELKRTRGICFEEIVFYIERGDILDDYLHPNRKRYPEQRIMVIGINKYAYLVPYVEDMEEIFLKTIIPSRKVTDIYFGGVK
ncbi:MAG: BrnT family toxin [Deltaproteobacteria bacterium]|nr:BrnT family toxin [Deltaproteobacteria bacterium]